jgi:hypothetical protein
MTYERLHGIPPALLKPGRNVLAQTLTAAEAAGGLGGGKLIAFPAPQAAVHWGPIVTRAAGQAAAIVCRTGAHVPAVLRLDGREIPSPAGTLHRWPVDGLKPGATYAYAVTPGAGAAAAGTIRMPAAGDAATIVLAGDPQSGAPWNKIARAVAKAAPDLCVLLGDLVVDGLADESWGRSFFQPAAALLANTPCRVVMGNHDRRSPVIDGFLLDGGLNWSQEIGNALVVGIDGGKDWSAGGENARWLEQVLATRKARFAFVASHYPAWSSRNHGKLAGDGLPLERGSRVARTQIVPILEKHRVTAFFTGHDHGYERSELPSGLSAIVTGGAGAGSYGKHPDAAGQNPHTAAFATKHHFCLLRVDAAAVTLTAVTPEGETIDTRTWSAKDAATK